MECFEGICMICHETTNVRHINLYVIGSEGLRCCKTCEDRLLEFVRKMMREAGRARKAKFLKRKEVIENDK